jgi:hypothetical protein
MQIRFIAMLVGGLLSSGAAFAQQAVTPAAELPIRDMETLVVSGVQPGPGLWKVRKGDHTLWLLGTVSPLPRRMQWESRDVEKVIAQAQEVIDPPGVKIDAKIGIFQQLWLAPKAFAARRNPDGQTLQQIVSPAMYARWQVLKARYIGRDADVEEYRPMFAAMELFQEAIEGTGLRQGGVVYPVVERLRKRHDVPKTETRVTVMIADPKVALQEFRESRLDDLDCFDKTLQRLESRTWTRCAIAPTPGPWATWRRLRRCRTPTRTRPACAPRRRRACCASARATSRRRWRNAGSPRPRPRWRRTR